MNAEMRSSSVSSVVQPQSVSSRISVVRVEETEVRGAEYLDSGPVDKAVRLLADATCLSSRKGCKAGAMMPGAVGMLCPSDSDSVGPVGPYGTLSPSDSDSVGPVGPYGMLSLSDSEYVGPVGLYGTLSPSESDSVGPVGPCGTLSPYDFDSVGPVGPDGTLSTSDLAGILIPAVSIGIPFPVGHVGPMRPVGTSSPSDFDYDGPVGPVGKLSPFDTGYRPSLLTPTVAEMSSVDPACVPPGGLITVTGTDCMASTDPVIAQLPADGPVGEKRDVVDMDVAMNNCSAAPDVSDSCAVVAMVGPDMVRRREEAPINCDDGCAEWDIRNEFETIDGTPVYYGGDSDGSEWDDLWDLAYAEYADQNNFAAKEGMELKVFHRLKGGDEQAMVVTEVPDPRHASPNLSGSLLRADMVDSETAVDILTEGHDVSKIAESPIQQVSGVTDGDGRPFIMRVISVIRTVSQLRIVRGMLGRTGVILLFTMDMAVFPRMLMIRSHRLCSVISCFGMTTLLSHHECGRSVKMRQGGHRQFLRARKCH